MTKRNGKAWGWGRSNRVSTPEYRRNRKLVRLRDEGCCIRCLTIDERVVAGKYCDHFQPQATGGGDSLDNLWLLCEPCHLQKTNNESNGRSGFNVSFGQDGFPIDEPDWLRIIARRNLSFINRTEGE